ncbi:MAG: ribosome maturation factor RimM [Parvibaculaceae bacterium]
MASEPDQLLVLGVITGAHGVSGRVRVKPFTETPESLGDYGPVTVQGKARKIRVTGVSKGQAIAALEGVNDRNAAEAMRGQELSVPRAALGEAADPEEEGWFHADLIGLTVETETGEKLGTVAAIHDFGAGDLLEIQPGEGPSVLMAFTQENVPVVDVAGGRLVADPPAGTFGGEEGETPPRTKRRRSPRARARQKRHEAGSKGPAPGEGDADG